MRVLKNLTLEIPGTNTHYFRLDEFSNDDGKNVLLYGYQNLENNSDFDKVKDYKRKVYLNVTMPTEFCSPQSTDADDKFDEVYGICPYTNNWLNDIKQKPKYKTIFYPFSKKDIPITNNKVYDVCYHGGIHGKTYVECLDIISKFNYRYMSMTHGINELTHKNLYRATNLNLTNQQKLSVIASTKISICYNTFPVRDGADLNNIKSRKDWWKNEAFSKVETEKIIPQFKSRFNEAAMAKTLNLIKRDNWNIVEKYYTPDEDFIYFDSNEELKIKIEEILNNWQHYQNIINNAYNKSLNYTSEALYNIIKKGD